ncbi:MAG: SWIM zinc finger family protein [Rubrivivax sp.]
MVGRWFPYVPVAERHRKAAGAMGKLTSKGQTMSPVVVLGRTIATTAWGQAWFANMESYSDYSNRLPRGRTYVRNGSVIDLQITTGTIAAQVSGSTIYRTTITVQPVPKAQWQQICADCSGGIDSLVELLQGRLSRSVMDRLCRQGSGLFPMPRDIHFDCSCPDGAFMCKHVAAVLYGVGVRFDSQPELLFTLRQVDPAELLSKAGSGVLTAPAAGERTLVEDDLGALFGLEMEGLSAAALAAPTQPRAQVMTVRVASPSAKSSRPGAKPVRTSDPASRLLAALRQAGSLDNAAARAATGLDAQAVRTLLKQLVDDGLARVQGQKRATRYVSVGKQVKA